MLRRSSGHFWRHFSLLLINTTATVDVAFFHLIRLMANPAVGDAQTSSFSVTVSVAFRPKNHFDQFELIRLDVEQCENVKVFTLLLIGYTPNHQYDNELGIRLNFLPISQPK